MFAFDEEIEGKYIFSIKSLDPDLAGIFPFYSPLIPYICAI
jgi:hypothetical protein